MICLLAAAFGLTGLVAVLAEKKEETKGLLCVTSFYPVQLLAESVSDGAEGVTVRNLTERHSGCIHDYTLTTQDMRLLSEAELFLINGGDMELFLEKAASEYKSLTIVDTSEGYAFLEGLGHTYDHSESAHEDEHGEAEYHDGESEEHAGHSHALNAHLWLDIDGYLLQLSRVEEAFVAADPAQAALYRANAEKCRTELTRLKAEYETAKPALAGTETVVFHEGFVYLLNMLGIETVHCISMDSDTQIAAGEAAEIMEECRLHKITRLFADADYAKTVADTFAGELCAEVVVLDPVTGGTAGGSEKEARSAADVSAEETDSAQGGIALYCEIMRDNLDIIQQAYGVR